MYTRNEVNEDTIIVSENELKLLYPRIKDFIVFAVQFITTMKKEHDSSPFLEISQESQTQYLVNEDGNTLSFHTYLPSYVILYSMNYSIEWIM